MTETALDKQRRWSRDAKRKRTGTCRRCGGVTRYGGKTGRAVASVCATCLPDVNRERGLERRGTVGKTAAILDYLSEPRTYSDVRDEFGMADGYASSMLDRLRKYGLIRRISRGVYQRVER